jgi:hypothetical protein
VASMKSLLNLPPWITVENERIENGEFRVDLVLNRRHPRFLAFRLALRLLIFSRADINMLAELMQHRTGV